jgi:hypothetical protein
MGDDLSGSLSRFDLRDLCRVAGFMIPESPDYGVPGADDPAIITDIVNSLDRDMNDVRKALAALRDSIGGDFAAIDDTEAEAAVVVLLGRREAEIMTLGRVVLQCYYRDERVLRSLGLDSAPPFPKGHSVEQGDWSQLEPVRSRAPMWRDVGGRA